MTKPQDNLAAAACHMATSNRSLLLRLPIEVRLTIYDHVFKDAILERAQDTSIPSPAILTVSQQIRTEAFNFCPRYLKLLADRLDNAVLDLYMPQAGEEHYDYAMRYVLSDTRVTLQTRSLRIGHRVYRLNRAARMRETVVSFNNVWAAGGRKGSRDIK